jgi:hypothetical protein
MALLMDVLLLLCSPESRVIIIPAFQEGQSKKNFKKLFSDKSMS